MLTTHATGSATMPLIASCSFVFRVVGFIIDDSKKKKKIQNVFQAPSNVIMDKYHILDM